MIVTPIKVSKMEVESFHVDYEILVPSGNYLIFPVSGYTVTMRNPGIPVVHYEDGSNMFIRVRYDFAPSSVIASRGDNTWPNNGDILCYLVEMEPVQEDLIYHDIEALLEHMDKRIAELEKPKKRGPTPTPVVGMPKKRSRKKKED